MSEPSASWSQLTLFAEAFPASPTPWLVDAPALKTSATSGRSLPDSFASLDPDGSWRKTCQGYSQVMLDGFLGAFSETWPRAGMTRNGIAYRRPPLAPLTDATGCGSWPTPKVSAHRNSRHALTQKHFSAVALEQAVELRAGILPREVDSLSELPPMARAMWPTPCAEDAKNVPYQKGRDGVTRYPMLLGAVVAARMWPTRAS